MTAHDTNSKTEQLQELLEYLKRSRGFDFSGYKSTTLSRRIEKRMAAAQLATFAEYQDYLEVNAREFTELFNTILINVTSFFRDAPAWEFLATDVVPQLLESQRDDDLPLRVWSAGCASGEEGYTAAMVLAEALGTDAFKSRVKIYATDLDDVALAEARHGVYSADALEAVPPHLVDKSLRAEFARHGVPPGPAPLDHLRTERRRGRRPDLADRPPALPQRAHVLHP